MNFHQSTISQFFKQKTTSQAQPNSTNNIASTPLSSTTLSSLFHPQPTPPAAATTATATTPKHPIPTKSSTTPPPPIQQQQPQHPQRQQSHLLHLLQQHGASPSSTQPQQKPNTESTMARISRNYMPFIEPNSTEKKPMSYLERIAQQNRPSPYKEADDPVRVKNPSTSQFSNNHKIDDDENDDDDDDDIVEITAPQKKSTPAVTSSNINNKRRQYDEDEDDESEEEFVKNISSSFNQQAKSNNQQSSQAVNANSLKGPLKPGFDLTQFRYQLDPASLKAERQKRSETLKPASLLPPQHPFFPGLTVSQPQNTAPVILPASLKSIVSTESPSTPVLVSNSDFSEDEGDDDDEEEINGDETTKKQRLTNSSEKRTKSKKHQFDCVKKHQEMIHEKKLRRDKLRKKEEDKIQRARQELIEEAQQREKERKEGELRSQREKLVQIKRAEELRKKKDAIAQKLQIRTTLDYRNRMKEQLRNMNVEEELKDNRMTAATSKDINDTTGVHSIAGNMKRNLMDFDFLNDGTDEAADTNNYFALLRFVFSQDFNRQDILRIENKRIPNKFSNWKEYFSIFEYLFLMECVANIQSAFVSFKSHENYRSPLRCYVRPVSMKENSHGFLELQVCRHGQELDEGEIRSSIEDDYYTLMSMRNHAVLLSSTYDMDLSTLSTKPTHPGQPFLFFAWVVPPDKADPKSLLKLYVDLEQSTFAAAFQEQMVSISIFNFTKMTTFIREYLAIKNMRECPLNRYIYNPMHIAEHKTAISDPCNNLNHLLFLEICLLTYFFAFWWDVIEILIPLLDELQLKYNHSQFQSIREISLTSEGICMLQGPPGTGKTHTLLGLLSGFYYYIKKNPNSTKPKIMICAPSNTAVDEIVSRIVESGLHQPGGVTVHINVVRIGAIDYVPKDNVKRASLEYKIEKKLREMGLQQQQQQQQQSQFGSRNAKNQLEQETLIDMRINVARVNQDIEKAKKELVGNELKDQLNHLFSKKRELKAKIAVQKLDKVARRDQIKQVSDQILGLADVVCCTLTSSLSEKLERFKDQIEVLIVDEAAQCSEPNNIIPLFYQPNKMVLIGDPKQLPATTFQPESNITKYNRSLFERIIDNSIQPYFLDEQYRMHPDIRDFPSSAFYNNKLRDGQFVLTREFPRYVQRMERHNVQFIDITFSRERFSNKSYENDAEAEGALSICSAVFATLRENESPSIGIITPYKQQTKLINDMIRRTIEKQFWKFIQVNTVDSFQGQEKDIIIFTTVRACHPNDKYRERMIGFLQDERRMNVALTRARFCLFVLGHADTLNSNLIWGNYVDSMAAKKRYGKLTRREELRGIGQYIMTGALISPESLSSEYVKKDWGDEFRLAQQVKEQVKELKLTDFEEEPAPMEIEEGEENDEIVLKTAAAATTTTAAVTDTVEIAEETENTYNEDYYDSIPKRSGVSIQDAIDQANEQQYMRQFGSGIKGLSSLVGLSGTIPQTKTTIQQPKQPQQVIIDPLETQIIVIPPNESESNVGTTATNVISSSSHCGDDLFDENSTIEIEIDSSAGGMKSEKDSNNNNNALDIYDQMQQQKKLSLAAAAAAKKDKKSKESTSNSSNHNNNPNPNILSANLSPKAATTNSLKSSNATSPTSHFSTSASTTQSSSSQSSDKQQQRVREKEQQKQQQIDKDLQQKVKQMTQQQKEKEQQKQKEQVLQQLQQVQQLQQQQKIQKEKEAQIAKERELERARQKANNPLYSPVLPDFPSPSKPSTSTSQSNSAQKSQQQQNSASPSFLSPHSLSSKQANNTIQKTTDTKPFSSSDNNNNKQQQQQQKQQQSNGSSRNTTSHDSDHTSLSSSLSSLFHSSSTSTMASTTTKPISSSSNSSKQPNYSSSSSSSQNKNKEEEEEDVPKSMFAQLSGLVSSKDKSPTPKTQQQPQKQSSVYDAIAQSRSTSGPNIKSSSSSNNNNHSTGHSSGQQQQQQSKHLLQIPQSTNFQQRSPQSQSHNNNNNHQISSSSSSNNNSSSISLRDKIQTKQSLMQKSPSSSTSNSSVHSPQPNTGDSRQNKTNIQQLNSNNHHHQTASPLSGLIKPQQQQQTTKQPLTSSAQKPSDNITRMKSSDNISDILNNIYIRKQ